MRRRQFADIMRVVLNTPVFVGVSENSGRDSLLVIAGALIAPPDKFVALRDQQESVFTIELRDTCEGQLPPIS